MIFSLRTAIRILIGVLVFLIFTPPLWAKSQAEFQALVVSADSSFVESEKDLNFATMDANRVVTALRQASKLRKKNIFQLKNPTVKQLNQAVRRLVKNNAKKFLFYYSGHSDENGLHLKDGNITKKKFHSMLGRISSKIKIVVLDSCFSGALKTKGVKKSSAIEGAHFNVDEPTGSVILTSSSGNEFSYESEKLKGSIFTNHLVAGLYGQADGNADGLVTIDELYQYVYSQTKFQSMVAGGNVQSPEFHTKLKGQGAVVVSFPARLNGEVLLDDDLGGELTMASSRGINFFKFYKNKGEDHSINLPKGPYDVTLIEKSSIGKGRITVAANGTIDLKREDLVWKDRTPGSVSTKGTSSSLKLKTTKEYLFGLKLSSHPGFKDDQSGSLATEFFMLTPAADFLSGNWRFSLHFGGQSHLPTNSGGTKKTYNRLNFGAEASYNGLSSWGNHWIYGLRVGAANEDSNGTNAEKYDISHLSFGSRWYPESFFMKVDVLLGIESYIPQRGTGADNVLSLGVSLSY